MSKRDYLKDVATARALSPTQLKRLLRELVREAVTEALYRQHVCTACSVELEEPEDPIHCDSTLCRSEVLDGEHGDYVPARVWANRIAKELIP